MRGIRATAAALALMGAVMTASAAAAAESASIVMYHRFGEDRHPSTSIRLEQFEAHLAELINGDYWVLPLPDIVAALRAGRPLPDNAVAITIDDAALSVFTEAWPRLRRAGLPFTLFVSTDIIDQGAPGYMSWAQIREMAADDNVTIGVHGAGHDSYATLAPDQARRDLERARARLREHLGAAPSLLAWPYGETNAALLDLAAEMGFDAAFGQHSGVAHGSQDPFYLPRFPLNEHYGGLDRFRLVARALPLPVSGFAPADPLLRDNPPAIAFTVGEGAGDPGAINCFASHLGRVGTEVRGRRVSIRLDEPFPPGRGRINCTMPTRDGGWRWLGYQWVVPDGLTKQ